MIRALVRSFRGSCFSVVLFVVRSFRSCFSWFVLFGRAFRGSCFSVVLFVVRAFGRSFRGSCFGFVFCGSFFS